MRRWRLKSCFLLLRNHADEFMFLKEENLPSTKSHFFLKLFYYFSTTILKSDLTKLFWFWPQFCPFLSCLIVKEKPDLLTKRSSSGRPRKRTGAGHGAEAVHRVSWPGGRRGARQHELLVSEAAQAPPTDPHLRLLWLHPTPPWGRGCSQRSDRLVLAGKTHQKLKFPQKRISELLPWRPVHSDWSAPVGWSGSTHLSVLKSTDNSPNFNRTYCYLK